MSKASPQALATLCDQNLAKRVVARDKGAFEQIMRRYNQRLYRAARSIVGNDQDAEEAVQDAYLKAWQNMGSFREQARLSTWLTRIAINEALGRLRKQRRREALLPMATQQNESTLHYEEIHQMPQSLPQIPEQLVERADVRRLVERHIDELPDGFRTVFVLRALEEMSVPDTARCLDIPEATVRSRYFRARSLLRTALSREMDMTVEQAFSFDGQRCDRIVARVLNHI